MKKYLTLLIIIAMGAGVWISLQVYENTKPASSAMLKVTSHPALTISSGIQHFFQPAPFVQLLGQTAISSLHMSQFAHHSYTLLNSFITYSGQDVWRSLGTSPVGKLLIADIQGGAPLRSYTKSYAGKNNVPDWFLHWMVRFYLQYGTYNVQGYVEGSQLPLLNFALFGYNLSNNKYNERIFEAAQILINRGANINALDITSGRTALHEAIFMNYTSVVEFLVKNNADPNIRVNKLGSFFNNTDALSFALKCEKMDKNMDYSKVIWLVRQHQQQYTATQPRSLQDQ